MWKLGLRPSNSFPRIHKWDLRCSVASWNLWFSLTWAHAASTLRSSLGFPAFWPVFFWTEEFLLKADLKMADFNIYYKSSSWNFSCTSAMYQWHTVKYKNKIVYEPNFHTVLKDEGDYIRTYLKTKHPLTLKLYLRKRGLTRYHW
jgi:hypothetical protein